MSDDPTSSIESDAADNDPMVWLTGRYPAADISPDEFEEFVADALRAASPLVQNLTVETHDVIASADGEYNFDATARFELFGVSFVVLIEAKRHNHPIKREYVQVLHSKVNSVGAHKGVMFSTAPYQSGAVAYAKAHGVALVKVTEGRFTIEAKARDPMPVPSRQDAQESGFPVFVGHHYGIGDEPGSTSVTLISPEYPEYIAELLLGAEVDPPTSGST